MNSPNTGMPPSPATFLPTRADHSAPLVSIVVATRNVGATIDMTLTSIRAQTDTDYEVIVVDGASTDDTVERARLHSVAPCSVVSEPDQGIADAWNKGVARACGRWILFLNAGDLLHPRHLERARLALAAAEGDDTILFCDVLKTTASGGVSHVIRGRAPTRASVLRGGIGFGHPGSLAPRALLLRLGGFDTSVRIAIDTDLLLRAFQAGCRFEHFDSCAYMAEGGVSDRRFGLALAEFYASAVRAGVVHSGEVGWRLKALPAARAVLRVARRLVRPVGRQVKHAGVAAMNAVLNLLPFASWRRVFMRTLRCKVGDGVSIGQGTRIYLPGRLSIGARSVINRGCLIDNRGGVDIGHDVSIARDVRIFTGYHDIDSPFFEMLTAPVSIGDHAVLFAGCTVMPGVTIGAGAVVYGGSVVTRDVAPMTVVAGSPARVVRKRLSAPAYALEYPFPLAM